MVADGMLTRKRYREVPPRVDYELTERSRDLAAVLGELARWGYEWAWGQPRPAERVDPGAMFRLVPGLIGPGAVPAGTVELAVTDDHDGQNARYLVTVGPDGATVREGAEGSSDAQVSGPTAAWVRAFSPVADRSGLSVAGNVRLADGLLDHIALGRPREGEMAEVRSATG